MKAIDEERRVEEEQRKEEEGVSKINLRERIKPFTDLRKNAVLEFFYDHFKEMARKSNEFRNEGQAYLYSQMCKIIAKVCFVRSRTSFEADFFSILEEMKKIRGFLLKSSKVTGISGSLSIFIFALESSLLFAAMLIIKQESEPKDFQQLQQS